MRLPKGFLLLEPLIGVIGILAAGFFIPECFCNKKSVDNIIQ